MIKRAPLRKLHPSVEESTISTLAPTGAGVEGVLNSKDLPKNNLWKQVVERKACAVYIDLVFYPILSLH